MEFEHALAAPRRWVASRWWLLMACLLLSLTARGENDPPPDPPMAATVHPDAAVIKQVLEAAEHPRLKWRRITDVREALDAFYGSRAYAPVWTREQSVLPQANALVSILADAETQGLAPQDYEAALLQEWLPRIAIGADPAERALFDTALTIATMRYAASLHRGRVPPQSGGFGPRDAAPKPLDLPGWLSQLVDGADPATLFASLEPRSLVYGQLKSALRALRAASASPVDRHLPLSGKLAPGDHSPVVPKLRALLSGSVLSAAAADATDDDAYDPVLVEAVKRFQRQHGLEPDGVVGKATVERLQLTDEERIMQIRLAMERQRWLPDAATGRHLLVNVPAFQLFAFADGLVTRTPDFAMKVIVGQAADGRRTPLFAADMTYVVFRPHWNLPYRIATKEMLPGALRNPGYLARHNIELVSGYGAAGAYAPTRENLLRVSSGALKLRQKPGPKNALGLVKFAFPNQDSVYLHSTPNQGLFARARRDFSHGCIRVADPVALAEWVLRDEPAWTRERIVQAMHGNKPRTVSLARSLPVTIFYSTVWVDEAGEPVFFSDIYGHDAVLRARLERGFADLS